MKHDRITVFCRKIKQIQLCTQNFPKFFDDISIFCKNWIKNFFCLLGTITSEKIKCLNLCVHIKKAEGKKLLFWLELL